MTILRQLGLCMATLMVMAWCGYYVDWTIYPIAIVGGWTVSQYDTGRKHAIP